MNCVEARRMVVPYVKGELSEKELEQFLKHIDHCSDCMDELDIYFTVYQAMDLLETGERPEYDFKKLLGESIHTAKRHILLSKTVLAVRMALICVADLLLILCAVIGLQTASRQNTEPLFRRILMNFDQPADFTEEGSALSTEDLSEVFSEVPVEKRDIIHTESNMN